MSDDRRHHAGRRVGREDHLGRRLSEQDRILRIQQAAQQDRAASGNNLYGQPGPVPYMPDPEGEYGENRVGGTTGPGRGGVSMPGELTGSFGLGPDLSITAEGIGDDRSDASLNDPQRQRQRRNRGAGSYEGGYDEQGLTAGDIRRLRG